MKQSTRSSLTLYLLMIAAVAAFVVWSLLLFSAHSAAASVAGWAAAGLSLSCGVALCRLGMIIGYLGRLIALLGCLLLLVIPLAYAPLAIGTPDTSIVWIVLAMQLLAALAAILPPRRNEKWRNILSIRARIRHELLPVVGRVPLLMSKVLQLFVIIGIVWGTWIMVAMFRPKSLIFDWWIFETAHFINLIVLGSVALLPLLSFEAFLAINVATGGWPTLDRRLAHAFLGLLAALFVFTASTRVPDVTPHLQSLSAAVIFLWPIALWQSQRIANSPLRQAATNRIRSIYEQSPDLSYAAMFGVPIPQVVPTEAGLEIREIAGRTIYPWREIRRLIHVAPDSVVIEPVNSDGKLRRRAISYYGHWYPQACRIWLAQLDREITEFGHLGRQKRPTSMWFALGFSIIWALLIGSVGVLQLCSTELVWNLWQNLIWYGYGIGVLAFVWYMWRWEQRRIRVVRLVENGIELQRANGRRDLISQEDVQPPVSVFGSNDIPRTIRLKDGTRIPYLAYFEYWPLLWSALVKCPSFEEAARDPADQSPR